MTFRGIDVLKNKLSFWVRNFERFWSGIRVGIDFASLDSEVADVVDFIPNEPDYFEGVSSSS